MIGRFQALSPARQWTLAALAVGVLSLALALFWLLVVRVPFEPLFAQLRSADAATVIADLDARKIPYRLADAGTAIQVPADKVDATRLAVMSEDLPIKGTVGFELFNKSDMGLTDFAQKVNYQRALQGELARTIMTIDGVDSARVHLSLGEDRVFRDDRVPPKASVVIRMREGGALAENAAQGIQRLVAAAVPQLEISDVVILDEEGRAITTPSAVPTEIALPANADAAAIEQYYAAIAQKSVGGAVDAGHVSVSVRADPPAGSSLTGWTPDSRNFPLRVWLRSDMPPGAQERADLRARLISDLGLDAAKGDTLSFGVAPAPLTTSAPRATTSRWPVPRSLDSADATRSGGGTSAILIALGVLAAMLALVIGRRASTPRALSPDERTAFADRLRIALDEGGAHGRA